jgi:hypothetical protein
MRIVRSLRAASSFTLLVALGCGSDPEGSNPIAPATLSKLFSALCAASERCGATLGVRSCERPEEACIVDEDAEIAFAGGCIDELKRIDCDTLLYGVAPITCVGAFRAADFATGSSDEGGPCVDSADCASDLTCTGDGASCGTCVPAPGEGEPCSDDGACASGLTCGDDDLCRRAPALGEACTSDYECTGYAVCVGGTCSAPTVRGEGEPLGDDDLCGAGLLPIDDVCVAFADVGEPCKPGQCYLGSVCDGGVCTALASCGTVRSGEVCDVGERCEEGLSCMYENGSPVGRCLPDGLPIGEACEWSYDCGSRAFCDDGVCASLESCGGEPAAEKPRLRPRTRLAALLRR